MLAAEPGIQIDHNGPIRLLEAVDDHGRDLRPVSTRGAVTNQPSFRTWSRPEPSTIGYALPLDVPEEAGGGRIARLRGYAPIGAVGRVDEVLSIPLDEAAGKTFTGGGLTVEVHDVDGSPTRFVIFTVRGIDTRRTEGYAPGPRQTTLAIVDLPFDANDHARVEDAEGHPLRITVNRTTLGPDPSPDAASYRIQVRPGRDDGPPARLRLFGVAAVATEVPFEFNDLPIP